MRGELNLPSDILLYLGVVILVALIGGLWPALGRAVVGSLLLNYYFTPPLYTFTISDKNNALALLVFIAVAALVSVLVERVVRRTTEASRASAEAAVLAGLAGGILRGETSLPQILGRARETFGLEALTLLERSDTAGEWQEIDHVGERRPRHAPPPTSRSETGSCCAWTVRSAPPTSGCWRRSRPRPRPCASATG